MLAKTFGGSVFGINATLIDVEVKVTQGTKFFMVGLPDNAIKESQQRVESAIKEFGYTMPRQKVIVNLAPADIRKEGSSYDLPIALGVLKASGQISTTELDKYLILGELGLDGKLRPIKGVLSMAIEARKSGLKGFILPALNSDEAAIVDNLDVIPVTSLKDAIDFLEGKKNILPLDKDTRDLFFHDLEEFRVDYSEVKGNEGAKRALEIAAAGGHNVLMIGPPGSGKTMMARRFHTILPPLTLREALETTRIHSVAGKLKTKGSLMNKRPFRSPHHTASDVSLVGGGSIPQPGEISLAHNGVLFLDELPEFKRSVLEVLRQPLEDRKVTISRAKGTVDFPANFTMVASMNPSPSGSFYDPENPGKDSIQSVKRYLAKVSGPLLDRMDMHIEVNPVSFDKISSNQEQESSNSIRKRVINAREIQSKRYENNDFVHSNAMMTPTMMKDYCQLSDSGLLLLKRAMEKLKLSSRAYDRILKVSRTIADLSGSEEIKIEYLAEAVQYRSLDREEWLG